MIDLNFKVPITEIKQVTENISQDFLIQGVAINATITGNNHKFLEEELKSSAQSLNGVPLLIDHKNEVDAIKGRVIFSEYNEINKNIPFKAKVNDSKIQELIKRGDLNTVSVGANVREIEEGENGVLIPRGITFKELSLVAVPADDGATFEIALKEAYSKIIEQEMEKCKECGKMILKSEMKDHMKKMHESQLIIKMEVNKMSEKVEEKKEETQSLEAEKVESTDTSKLIKESIEQGIKDGVKKALESMPKVEKVESKLEVEETEDEIDEKLNYKIVQGNGSIRGGSFTLIRDYGKR